MTFKIITQEFSHFERSNCIDQKILNLITFFKSKRQEMQMAFKSQLFVDFSVKSNQSLKEYLFDLKNQNSQKLKKDQRQLKLINKNFENNEMILKIIGNSFKFIANIPVENLEEKLVKIPLKFLFKFKKCPGIETTSKAPIKIIQTSEKMTECEKKFRKIMIKSGLNKELNWQDNRCTKNFGIYELENGSKQSKDLLIKISAVGTFLMTLAVLYSKSRDK